MVVAGSRLLGRSARVCLLVALVGNLAHPQGEAPPQGTPVSRQIEIHKVSSEELLKLALGALDKGRALYLAQRREREAAQVRQVLLPYGLVQVVFGFDVFLDLRGELLLGVERPPGQSPQQEKSYGHDREYHECAGQCAAEDEFRDQAALPFLFRFSHDLFIFSHHEGLLGQEALRILGDDRDEIYIVFELELDR